MVGCPYCGVSTSLVEESQQEARGLLHCPAHNHSSFLLGPNNHLWFSTTHPSSQELLPYSQELYFNPCSLHALSGRCCARQQTIQQTAYISKSLQYGLVLNLGKLFNFSKPAESEKMIRIWEHRITTKREGQTVICKHGYTMASLG